MYLGFKNNYLDLKKKYKYLHVVLKYEYPYNYKYLGFNARAYGHRKH